MEASITPSQLSQNEIELVLSATTASSSSSTSNTTASSSLFDLLDIDLNVRGDKLNESDCEIIDLDEIHTEQVEALVENREELKDLLSHSPIRVSRPLPVPIHSPDTPSNGHSNTQSTSVKRVIKISDSEEESKDNQHISYTITIEDEDEEEEKDEEEHEKHEKEEEEDEKEEKEVHEELNNDTNTTTDNDKVEGQQQQVCLQQKQEGECENKLSLCKIIWHNISHKDRIEIEKLLQKAITRDEEEEHKEEGEQSDALELVGPNVIPSSNGKKGAVQYFKGWSIDLTGLPLDHSQKGLPKYKKIDANLSAKKDALSSSKKISKCFNCGEPGHVVRDCPQPRNEQSIKKSREEYDINKSPNKHSKSLKLDRYWEEEELIPGKLSSQLREALGMSADDLPPWYPTMLRYGYPPGYLQPENEPILNSVAWVEDQLPPSLPNEVEAKLKEDAIPLKEDGEVYVKKKQGKMERVPLKPLVEYPLINMRTLLLAYKRMKGDAIINYPGIHSGFVGGVGVVGGVPFDQSYLKQRKRKRTSSSDMEMSDEDKPQCPPTPQMTFSLSNVNQLGVFSPAAAAATLPTVTNFSKLLLNVSSAVIPPPSPQVKSIQMVDLPIASLPTSTDTMPDKPPELSAEAVTDQVTDQVLDQVTVPSTPPPRSLSSSASVPRKWTSFSDEMYLNEQSPRNYLYERLRGILKKNHK